jgi:VanZ family protein
MLSLGHFIRKYPFSLLCFVAIWYLSLIFNVPETPLNEIRLIDKWVHIVMYGGTCTVLWIEYIRQHQRLNYKKLAIWAWLAPIVMSGIIELLQAYCTTTRNGDWMDMTANAIGVTLAVGIGLAIYSISRRSS